MGLEAADPDLLAASRAGGWSHPPGMVLDGARWTDSSHRRSPTRARTATATAWSTRSTQPRRLPGVLPPQLLQAGPLRALPDGVAKGRGALRGDRLRLVPYPRPGARAAIAASPTSRPNTTPEQGGFNGLFATANTPLEKVADYPGLPPLHRPSRQRFRVQDIFTDFKRHDLGPNFQERNFDGTFQHEFMTEPLWGVATTAPYGHDGRSINLREVILRHGGEAQAPATPSPRCRTKDSVSSSSSCRRWCCSRPRIRRRI